MAGGAVWQARAQAAQTWDAASYDRRRLREVEDALWPLATPTESQG